MPNICLRYATNKQELHNMLSLDESLFTCTRGCVRRFTEIRNVLDNYQGRLGQSGLRIGEYLGSGACGVAFQIKDNPGHILKLSYDLNEAALCELIKKKSLANVCPIKEVFLFEGTGLYGIIQKRLEKLNSKNDSAFMKVMESQTIKDIINRHIRGDIDEATAYRFAEASTKNIGAYYSESERQRACEAMRQVLGGISEIKEFAFPDLSKSNTMKSNEIYYLIDMKLRDDKYPLDMVIDQIPVLRR